ncbi:MAG: hypothetical protein ACFB15_25875 [Cyclobacteriaceae bacterium]
MIYIIHIKSAIEDGNGCLIRHLLRRHEIKARGHDEARRKANHLFFEDTGAHDNTMYGGYFHLKPVPDENLR